MKRVATGIVLCLIGITLIHANRWLPGLAAFISGFLLMMLRRR